MLADMMSSERRACLYTHLKTQDPNACADVPILCMPSCVSEKQEREQKDGGGRRLHSPAATTSLLLLVAAPALGLVASLRRPPVAALGLVASAIHVLVLVELLAALLAVTPVAALLRMGLGLECGRQ